MWCSQRCRMVSRGPVLQQCAALGPRQRHSLEQWGVQQGRAAPSSAGTGWYRVDSVVPSLPHTGSGPWVNRVWVQNCLCPANASTAWRGGLSECLECGLLAAGYALAPEGDLGSPGTPLSTTGQLGKLCRPSGPACSSVHRVGVAQDP